MYKDVKCWGKRARETPGWEKEDDLIGIIAFLQQHEVLWKWKTQPPYDSLTTLTARPHKLDLIDEVLEVLLSSYI